MSYFGLVILQLWKRGLLLEGILFVSICFYTFVITKELQTGYTISGLNSVIYIYVYI